MIKELTVDKLKIKIYKTRAEMGSAAALDASAALKEFFQKKEYINAIFAAAPSQNEMLSALCNDRSIDFSRVNALHMDEYVGLSSDDGRSFGRYLFDHVFSKANFASVNYINGAAKDPASECERYTEIYKRFPPDVVFMGIGENGHIAFNDPHEARFDDPRTVKTVSLDEKCRRQQVNDGCFPDISLVPKHAFTLTVPALCSAAKIFCVVPAVSKAEAVYKTVFGNISEECPASILRTARDATLYLDAQSASFIL